MLPGRYLPILIALLLGAIAVPAQALGHAHIWCGGLTRVGCGGFQNRESV